ncbi:MAG: nitroreductase [Proteobacteria bacterium]|nr:nitroreductase [Pseudomonadota bacterium]
MDARLWEIRGVMDAIALLASRCSNPKLGQPAPGDAVLDAVFEAAMRAPDHGLLRPWRLLTVRGTARERLGDVFARAELRQQPDASRATLDKARHKPLRAPLIVVVAACPRPHPKVPEIEQVLSAAAVGHGILLGLQAHGFAGFWRTGWYAYDAHVKEALGLRQRDSVVGFLYVGTATADPPAIARPDSRSLVSDWSGTPLPQEQSGHRSQRD